MRRTVLGQMKYLCVDRVVNIVYFEGGWAAATGAVSNEAELQAYLACR